MPDPEVGSQAGGVGTAARSSERVGAPARSDDLVVEILP